MMVLLRLLLLSFSFAPTGICQRQVASSPSLTPRLHVVAFASKHDMRSSYAQVSAEAHNLTLQFIGLGMNAWWPAGLGTKINAYRQFVLRHAADDDLVLMVDAFDVLLFGGWLEIVAGFEEIESQHHRSILFNAESNCFPWNCTEQPFSLEPRASGAAGERRFLNSGILIGRGRALRQMMKDKVPDVIKGSDQAWFQSYFKDHPEQILLDTNCRLICLINGDLESNNLQLTPDGRVRDRVTGNQPAVLHAVGPTHWPVWRRGGPSSILHELFHELYPTEEQRLFGRTWGLVLSLGPEIKITLFKSEETLRMVMKLGLCIQCRLLPEALGSGNNICKDFVSLFDEQCSTAGFAVVMLCVSISILIALWLRCFTRWSSYSRKIGLTRWFKRIAPEGKDIV